MPNACASPVPSSETGSDSVLGQSAETEGHATVLDVEELMMGKLRLVEAEAYSASIVGIEPLISRIKTGLPAKLGIQVGNGNEEAVDDDVGLVVEVELDVPLELALEVVPQPSPELVPELVLEVVPELVVELVPELVVELEDDEEIQELPLELVGEVVEDALEELMPQPVAEALEEGTELVEELSVSFGPVQLSQMVAELLELLACSLGSIPQVPVLIAPVLQLFTESKPGSSVPKGDQNHVPVLV